MRNRAMQRSIRGVKLPSLVLCVGLLGVWIPAGGQAQVNSGSNGSDGLFNPTSTNTVIDMADHPTGIYQYTSVNIPSNVVVRFVPNANNAPVVWLVQGSCTIAGVVDVSGVSATNTTGARGGPGGFSGGSGGNTGGVGMGPGGGFPEGSMGISASYGGLGTRPPCERSNLTNGVGPVYGNPFLLPLLGGSGGAGSTNWVTGGGGGAGAILIAVSGQIDLNGSIRAVGGAGSVQSYNAWPYTFQGGGGSGGGVRLVASRLAGTGTIDVSGGVGSWYYDNYYCGCSCTGRGGSGRVRLDVLANTFGGNVVGVFSQGYQPIIIPAGGQVAQLWVTSVGGVGVAAPPTGNLAVPDAVVSAQQASPVPVVVTCANVPVGTAITVSVRPSIGPVVSAVGYNSTGTLASSAATVMVNIPRGGGLIYATAAAGN
jgi:hypothetical protein